MRIPLRIILTLSFAILFAVSAFGQDGMSAEYVPATCWKYEVLASVEMAREGDVVKFSVKFESDEVDPAEQVYEWSISSGTILSGQGTPAIRVRMPSRVGEGITLIANPGVNGDRCEPYEPAALGVLPRRRVRKSPR